MTSRKTGREGMRARGSLDSKSQVETPDFTKNECKLTGATDVREVRITPSIPAGLYALRVSNAERHWTQSMLVLGE